MNKKYKRLTNQLHQLTALMFSDLLIPQSFYILNICKVMSTVSLPIKKKN